MENRFLSQPNIGCRSCEDKQRTHYSNKGSDHRHVTNLTGPDNESRYLSGNTGRGYTEMNGLYVPQSLAISNNDWPTVENGMLSFRDNTHFDNYVEYLENRVNNPEQNLLLVTQDDILDNIESKIGFTSLRRITEDAFQKLNEIGWQRVEDIPERHFIPDIVTKSILNGSADVKIGNRVIHFVNSSVAVSVPANNWEYLQKAHNLPYSTSKLDAKRFETASQGNLKLDGWSYNTGTVTNVISRDTHQDTWEPGPANGGGRFGGIRGGRIDGNMATKATAIDYFVSATKPTTPERCRLPLTIEIETISFGYYLGGPAQGKIVIEWGDGRSDTYLTNDGLYSSELWYARHDYISPGTYNVVVKGRPTSSSGPYATSEVFRVTVPDNCNVSAEAEKGPIWKYRGDTYRAVTGKNWVKQWLQWGSGNRKNRTGAKTEAYHWEKNWLGEWGYREYKAHRVTVEYWITKHNQDNCASTTNYGQFAGPYDQQSVEVQATGDGYFGWHKMTSRHELHTLDGWPPVVLEIETPVC